MYIYIHIYIYTYIYIHNYVYIYVVLIFVPNGSTENAYEVVLIFPYQHSCYWEYFNTTTKTYTGSIYTYRLTESILHYI